MLFEGRDFSFKKCFYLQSLTQFVARVLIFFNLFLLEVKEKTLFSLSRAQFE